MNEHDDDLESQVHEQADMETDTYPNTSDELDGKNQDEDEKQKVADLDIDPDKSEL